MSAPANQIWDSATIMDGGERVTHLYANDCYYAHLSIYRFALEWARGAVVLDAGSGAGYGAAYLADNGAAFVHGVELSEKAVAFSRASFQRPNLDFQVRDLSGDLGFAPGSFDLVFSSNVLEHVADVGAFLAQIVAALKPGGTMVLAVPPILSIVTQADNLANPYHLNIWSPRQWHHVLSQYFGAVAYYEHKARPGAFPDFSRPPEQASVDESDFEFHECPAAMIDRTPTLTAVFVLREPRRDAPAGGLGFVDQSFTLAPGDAAGRQERARQFLHSAALVQTYLAAYSDTPINAVELNKETLVQLDALRLHLEDVRQVVRAMEVELARRDGELVRKNARIVALDGELARKNEHIGRLERLIRQLENGRVMRLLRRFGR